MNIEFNTKKYELNDDIKKYVEKKIGKLDRKISRKVRSTIFAKVMLKENAQVKKGRFSCEVIMYLPEQQLIVEEATINMFAAVDIVESRLKNQISKYHSKHSQHRTERRKVYDRFRKLADRDFRSKLN